jgi:hypothetical protein
MVVLQYGEYLKRQYLTQKNRITKVKVMKLPDKLQFGTNVTKINQFGIYNLIILEILLLLEVTKV